jgi:hypothetical protein
MIFRELNRGKCKTYLAISEAAHKAAIIDPLRDKIERSARVLWIAPRLDHRYPYSR